MKTLDNRGVYKNKKNTTSNATSASITTSTTRNNSNGNNNNNNIISTSMSGDDDDNKDNNDGNWMCNRCYKASQTPINTGLPGLPKSIVKQCYSKNNFNGNIYYPTPEFGTGWCQAKRVNKLALKEIYLSPLGYELNSKEEALLHIEFEKEVHDNLLLNRENEYKEYR